MHASQLSVRALALAVLATACGQGSATSSGGTGADSGTVTVTCLCASGNKEIPCDGNDCTSASSLCVADGCLAGPEQSTGVTNGSGSGAGSGTGSFTTGSSSASSSGGSGWTCGTMSSFCYCDDVNQMPDATCTPGWSCCVYWPANGGDSCTCTNDTGSACEADVAEAGSGGKLVASCPP